MNLVAEQDRRWCEQILPRVSRTFALCIRFLPQDVRLPVLLSYLLCRIADTIEDSVVLELPRKRELLAAYAAALGERRGHVPGLADAFAEASGAEAELAREASRVLADYGRLPAEVQQEIAPWVVEMCRGMSEFSDLQAGAVATRGALRVLPTEEELDRYCYYVAGTVGHLLTGLFGRLRPRVTPDRLERMGDLAGSFGAGLQLTNIIVDAAVDQDRGVSYVPADLCREEGIAAGDLLRPAARRPARAVFGRLIGKARHNLQDALQYCENVPRFEYQIRLFCLVPVFLALKTLRAVEGHEDFPAPDQRIKIGRGAVYRTVTAARLCASSNHLTRFYAHHLQFEF